MALPTSNNTVSVTRFGSTLSTLWGKIKTKFGLKADLASPAFTGTPTAPTAAAGTNTTQIATTAFVKQAVTDGMATADAMQYKGTIVLGSTTPGGYTPAADKGHTYRVTHDSAANSNGYIDGVAVEVGDMLICNTDSTAAATSSNYATIVGNWDFVQRNLDGVVIGPASAVDGQIPVFDGATGKLIKNSGKTLTVTSTSVSDGTTTFNKYVHPTTAGNKHVPSGGSSGNILGYDSAGTAKWIAPTASTVGITVTSTSVTDGTTTFNKYTHPTSSGNKHVPSGGSSGKFLGWSADGTAAWVSKPNAYYVNGNEINFTNVPDSGAIWRHWFNYKNGDTNSADSVNKLTDYFFGNRNQSVAGVTIHAEGIGFRSFYPAANEVFFAKVTLNSNGWGTIRFRITGSAKSESTGNDIFGTCDMVIKCRGNEGTWNAFYTRSIRGSNTPSTVFLQGLYYQASSSVIYLGVRKSGFESRIHVEVIDCCTSSTGEPYDSTSGYRGFSYEIGDFNSSVGTPVNMQGGTLAYNPSTVGAGVGSSTTPVYLDALGRILPCSGSLVTNSVVDAGTRNTTTKRAKLGYTDLQTTDTMMKCLVQMEQSYLTTSTDQNSPVSGNPGSSLLMLVSVSCHGTSRYAQLTILSNINWDGRTRPVLLTTTVNDKMYVYIGLLSTNGQNDSGTNSTLISFDYISTYVQQLGATMNWTWDVGHDSTTTYDYIFYPEDSLKFVPSVRRTASSNSSTNEYISNNSTAADCKNYWTNMQPGAKIVYNQNGTEFTLFFSKSAAGTHGTILKWSYQDAYIQMLRVQANTWKSADWEPIAAGYANTCGNADTVDNTHIVCGQLGTAANTIYFT